MALLKILVKASYWASNDPLTSIDYGGTNILTPDFFVSGTLPLYDNFGAYGVSGPDLTADEEFVFDLPDGTGPFDTIGIGFNNGYEPYEVIVLESADGGPFLEIGSRFLPTFTYEVQFIDLSREPVGPVGISRLIKDLKYTFVPGAPGTPGAPGIPGSPGFTYIFNSQVCVFSPGDYAEAEARLLKQLASQGLGAGAGITFNAAGYACTTVSQPVYVPPRAAVAPIPAIPATPSQTIADFQIGWTGRAHSIAVMTGPGKFRFRVTSDSIGAVVGLTQVVRSSGFSDIEFGFYVVRGITKIMEGGAEVLNLGDRSDQMLEIRRSRGNIVYRVNDTIVYTRPNSPTPYILAAALYSGGDEVTDPSFEAFGEGDGIGKMRAFRSFAGVGNLAIAVGVMEPFTSGSGAGGTGQGEGVMRPFKSRGGIAYAVGEGVMLPFAGLGESFGDAPSYSLGTGALQPLTGAGTGLTGALGQGVGSLLALTGFAGDTPGGVARGTGRGVMRPLRSTVFNLTPADEVFAVSYAGIGAVLESFTELFAVVNSSMQITELIAVGVEYLAEVMNTMTLDDQIALDLEIEALVQSLMRVAAVSSDPSRGEASVYSLDMGGSTRYTNYGFNSFAQFDGAHYGAKPDGIYLLQGRNDEGTKVPAIVDFGKTNFGTALRKALPYVYVGAASDGRLLLKVTADKETFVYKLESSSEELKEQRFKLGKGLSATYYKLVLESEGSVFDLASIEFFPVQLSRRL